MTFGGWVNDHAHLDKGFLIQNHKYLDVSAPERASITRELKKSFTVSDIKIRAAKALQLMMDTGTVYIRTHVDVDPIVGLKGIEALLELKEELADRIILEITAYNQEGFDRYPEVPELLREAMRMGIKGIGGHTSIDANGRLHIDRTLSLAEEGGAEWIEFHTDETGRPADFLLPYLAEKSISEGIGPMITAIHCNSLSYVSDIAAEAAIELAARAGLQVTVCPTAMATRKLTKIKRMLDSEIRVRLGSDNIGDMFNPLGSGNMVQYAQLLAYDQRFFEADELQQLLQMMTRLPNRDHIHVQAEQLGKNVQYAVSDVRELIASAPLPIKMK